MEEDQVDHQVLFQIQVHFNYKQYLVYQGLFLYKDFKSAVHFSKPKALEAISNVFDLKNVLFKAFWLNKVY